MIEHIYDNDKSSQLTNYEPVRSLRILVAVSVPYPEGRSDTRRLRTFTRELVLQGCQIDVFLPYSRIPQSCPQIIDGTQVEWSLIPKQGHSFLTARGRVKLQVHLIGRFKWLWGVWRKLSSDQYDWLYLYQPGIDSLIAAAIARIYGRKVCSEYVDALSPDGYKGLILRLVYLSQLMSNQLIPLLSHHILTISSSLEQHYREKAKHATIMRFPIIVDTERFGHGEGRRFRKQLGLNGRFIIAYTGSFARPQGLRVLIEAVSKVVKQHPEVVLLIAGGSLAAESDDPDALIKREHLEAHVRYLGALGEAEVIELQSAADVLVMPKLDDPVNHAGLSTKLAEYLMSGNAVIASNVGDVNKYLVHERDAWLVAPGDCTALEDAITFLLQQDQLRYSLGVNGQKVAISAFGARANVARLAAAFRRYL